MLLPWAKNQFLLTNVIRMSIVILLKNKYHGEMSEWLKEAVLKTVVGQLTGGSNPSLSVLAIEKSNDI